MVFQFIEDIESCMSHLSGILKPGGVFAFTVFNPDYVRPKHGEGKLFQNFENPEQPTKGFMVPTADTKIPVFVRTEEEYDDVCTCFGLQRVYLDRPAFTPEFLEKYPSDADTMIPEYLVLVYEKL